MSVLKLRLDKSDKEILSKIGIKQTLIEPAEFVHDLYHRMWKEIEMLQEMLSKVRIENEKLHQELLSNKKEIEQSEFTKAIYILEEHGYDVTLMFKKARSHDVHKV